MERNELLKRGLTLEYLTLAWNIAEAAIAIWTGLAAGSIALFGFGMDSLIEILASIIVIWQLKSINKDKERFAEKLIGLAFIFLAMYLGIVTSYNLANSVHSRGSLLGMIFIFITAIVMFGLAFAKKKVGQQLGNPVLIAESKVTVVDGLLATAVGIGLIVEMALGLWWADSVASLVILVYGVKEAFHIFGKR